MKQPTRFIGMDVHKETIVVADTATGDVGKAAPYGGNGRRDQGDRPGGQRPVSHPTGRAGAELPLSLCQVPGYVPRQEGASFTAERVEWLVIPDPATASAALQSGQVD
jgi:hypothetical protein